jgi:hypothetical protein
MHWFAYALWVAAISWLVMTVQSRKKLVAVVLAGVLAITLGAPQPARAQAGILVGIQALLNEINGAIQTGLTAITNARNAIDNLQQAVVWPQQLINQAKAEILQLANRYRAVMGNIFQLELTSATLPSPQAFEAVIRNHQVNDFSNLGVAFNHTYGAIPVAASPADRALSDMDDAMTLDSLKLLKAADLATDDESLSADSIENAAGGAAPGAAPFLTATAVVSAIHSQALNQKMLAAELRQEAARLAHGNSLRKESAANTALLRGLLVNLLQHK